MTCTWHLRFEPTLSISKICAPNHAIMSPYQKDMNKYYICGRICTLAFFSFVCSLPWAIPEAGVEVVELASISGSHVANVGGLARLLGKGHWLWASDRN